MRADFEADGESRMGDGTRRDEIAIDDFYIAGRILRLETNGVGAGKGGIDEGRGGARINKRKCLDRGAAEAKGDSDNDVFFRVEVGVERRDCGSVKRESVGRSGASGTMAGATRARCTAQRKALCYN
jgi:hypothetical protein